MITTRSPAIAAGAGRVAVASTEDRNMHLIAF
jgi:hypothetical protein